MRMFGIQGIYGFGGEDIGVSLGMESFESGLDDPDDIFSDSSLISEDFFNSSSFSPLFLCCFLISLSTFFLKS